MASTGDVRLGLRENAAQFSLLVAVNAFVGAMVGLERSTLPLIGQQDFGVASSAAVVSFIAAFGLAKAVTNVGAGQLAAKLGRRRLLSIGWAIALPVPLLVALAPSWAFVVAANVVLGVNQGLTWSITVLMKVDLVGPKRRGFAMGLNEAAGYGGVALAAAVSGLVAAEWAPRDVLVVGALAIALVGLALTLLFVRDTAAHVAVEQAQGDAPDEPAPPLRQAFADASYRHPALRSCSQAGLVNNLNDALVWGLVPLFLAASGASLGAIGLVAGLYPAVWGVGQIATGAWSDRVGRKRLIVAGMLTQAAALVVLALSGGGVFLAAVAAVEMRRVLRPGGELRFFEHVVAHNQFGASFSVGSTGRGSGRGSVRGVISRATPRRPSKPPASRSDPAAGTRPPCRTFSEWHGDDGGCAGPHREGRLGGRGISARRLRRAFDRVNRTAIRRSGGSDGIQHHAGQHDRC